MDHKLPADFVWWCRALRQAAASLAAGAMVVGVFSHPAYADDIPLGIAITPRHFPNHTMADVDAAFVLGKRLARHSVFIYQWRELDLSVVQLMLEKSATVGMVPVVGLSPTTLDQHRKELDIPDKVRARAGGMISFSNPVIRQAFKEDAAKLAAFKLPYLCLATEINFLAIHRLEEYLHFVSLYKEAYRIIKQISPQTSVFVTFQWEWMRILDAREPHRIREHSKVIDVFRPELDTVGLTTYPSSFHANPAALPSDYFTWVFHHVPRHQSLLLMEVGWPSAGSGSVDEQRDFIHRLPRLLAGTNVSLLAWSLLHDVNVKEFSADLNTTGLVTHDGVFKAAIAAFDQLGGGS